MANPVWASCLWFQLSIQGFSSSSMWQLSYLQFLSSEPSFDLVFAGARIRGTGENVHFWKHVNYHVRCWVGVGGMLTFLALAHMLDATQDAGLGWGGCLRSLHLHTCWMLRKMLGWDGGDVNVPCSCTHVGCYARCWVGVGGDVNVPCACTHVGCYARCWVGVGRMLTFLALAHMLDAMQDAGLGWGGC